MRPVIYCADVGSVPNGRFGWARSAADESKLERHRGGTEIVELVDGLADDLAAGHGVALGFECPLFVPVPEPPLRLGMARPGEGNRSWSAGAGAGAMATGIVQVAWILSELRRRCPEATAYLDWAGFAAAGRGLFLWEAFVTDRAKAATHVDDATVAVAAFRDCLPDPRARNAVSAERPLSLLGAAMLWSGWDSDADLLRTPCLVVSAAPPPGGEAGRAAAQGRTAALDPARTPRAHRDPREVRRKRQLLQAPHVAPLTEFVRRVRAAHGGVPWFDPTEAGTEARILLLFENPGRRADAAQGSGFISADNDDPAPRTCGTSSARPASTAAATSSPGTSSPGTSATTTRSARSAPATSACLRLTPEQHDDAKLAILRRLPIPMDAYRIARQPSTVSWRGIDMPKPAGPVCSHAVCAPGRAPTRPLQRQWCI